MFPTVHGIVSQVGSGSDPAPAGAPLITGVGSLTNIAGASQFGWRFTVGASPITVTHLRAMIRESTSNVAMRLWRVKYQVLLATKGITTVADTWTDVALDSPVVLNSGEDYIVTLRSISGGNVSLHRTPIANATFAASITFVGGRSISTIAFPTTADATNLDGIPDLLHTIGGTPDTTSYLISALPAMSAPSSGLQVGWRFTVGASDIDVKGLRIYMASSGGEETARLWRVSDTTLLESVAITPEIASLWSEGLFAAPVTLTAGAQYVISTRRTNGGARGWYTGTGSGFTIDARVTRNAAHAVNADTYPGQDSSGSLYGVVDVILSS